MSFKSNEHSWAFILESEYNPEKITLSHYEVNVVVLSDGKVVYRSLEWTGSLLPELDTWTIFQSATDAAEFLRMN
jgi:hypothetical protein